MPTRATLQLPLSLETALSRKLLWRPARGRLPRLNAGSQISQQKCRVPPSPAGSASFLVHQSVATRSSASSTMKLCPSLMTGFPNPQDPVAICSSSRGRLAPKHHNGRTVYAGVHGISSWRTENEEPNMDPQSIVYSLGLYIRLIYRFGNIRETSGYKLPVDLLTEFLPFTGFEPRDIDKHWKQQRWWTRQMKGVGSQTPRYECASSRPCQLHFSVDVTSLLTADPDHPTILTRDGCFQHVRAMAWHWTTPIRGYAPGVPCPSDEFAALCNEAGLVVELEKGPDTLSTLHSKIIKPKYHINIKVRQTCSCMATTILPTFQWCILCNLLLPACQCLGWSFCPFVLEATGAWGGKTRHLTELITQKNTLCATNVR